MCIGRRFSEMEIFALLTKIVLAYQVNFLRLMFYNCSKNYVEWYLPLVPTHLARIVLVQHYFTYVRVDFMVKILPFLTFKPENRLNFN
jgi:hypothetical protein